MKHVVNDEIGEGYLVEFIPPFKQSKPQTKLQLFYIHSVLYITSATFVRLMKLHL